MAYPSCVGTTPASWDGRGESASGAGRERDLALQEHYRPVLSGRMPEKFSSRNPSQMQLLSYVTRS